MWNFRLVEVNDGHGNKTIGVHEVYYDEENKPQSMTQNPVKLTSCAFEEEDDAESVIRDLEMITKDIKYDKRILKYPEDFNI